MRDRGPCDTHWQKDGDGGVGIGCGSGYGWRETVGPVGLKAVTLQDDPMYASMNSLDALNRHSWPRSRNRFNLCRGTNEVPRQMRCLSSQEGTIVLPGLGAVTMDSLSVLVVAIGSLLLALVAYLAAVDYIDPLPERVDGFSPRPMGERRR
jgi:hypothetical protein